MKTKIKNSVFVIKGSSGANSVMMDLYNNYLHENELALMICYDNTNSFAGANKLILFVNPDDISMETLFDSTIPAIETGLSMYRGKIFIYTNKSEKDCKEMVKFLKSYNFKNYTNKDGETTDEHTIYLFCAN